MYAAYVRTLFVCHNNILKTDFPHESIFCHHTNNPLILLFYAYGAFLHHEPLFVGNTSKYIIYIHFNLNSLN